MHVSFCVGMRVSECFEGCGLGLVDNYNYAILVSLIDGILDRASLQGTVVNFK